METFDEAVSAAVSAALGEPLDLTAAGAVGGGCINETRLFQAGVGRTFFVKSNRPDLAVMFEREAEGLTALAAVGAIRIPRPIAWGSSASASFLVLEHVRTGSKAADFSANFGRRFAELHRGSRTDHCGFPHDNFIGSTPQPNPRTSNWVEFWRDHRLGFQLELARSRGRADARMIELGDRLIDRLDDLIGSSDDPPCLLHGDLWGGNYLVDEEGEPVLIDPATYHGHREADLAMTRLFGGFDARFYAAYEEIWPLADGHEERLEIYELYHQLNHLNLFGSGYRSGCMAILERFGR